MKVVHIFTRDLRVEDNTALLEIAALGKKVDNFFPVFVFTPEQVTQKENKYKSNNAVQFMIESLTSLNKSLNSKMAFYYGKFEKIVGKMLKRAGFGKGDRVYLTKDYTPFADKREKILAKICDSIGSEAVFVEDYCLHNPGTVLTLSGTVYQKYTPYYRNAIKTAVRTVGKAKIESGKIFRMSGSNYSLGKATGLYVENKDLNKRGGREEALKQLGLLKDQKYYDKVRNDLDKKTSELSAYIKFGNVSIREVFWKVKEMFGLKHLIIAQLIWHDFYYQLGYAFPKVMAGKPLKDPYSGIVWSKSSGNFDAWKNGMTGYPVVDAAMRQLNKIGYMHNRGRLIVASFLVKTLLIDWREGEKYFAQKLEDYDPLVNNGNWQWVSSSGADSQPYFRIFNPWLQGEKFDPTTSYIKYFVPELEKVPIKCIHQWYKYCDDPKFASIKYPKPIVDYKTAKEKVVKAYKKALD